jgi:hypothetical protein
VAVDPARHHFRFRGTALIDWMKAKDRRSRALSVSRKDRGAILPIGRAKESVFWFASNGNFTTSTYYSDTLPVWVKRFNARRIPQSYAGKAWEPLLPVSSYPEPDTVSVEDLGREPAFPHRLSADTARRWRDFIGFPWMDDLTGRLRARWRERDAARAGTGARTSSPFRSRRRTPWDTASGWRRASSTTRCCASIARSAR